MKDTYKYIIKDLIDNPKVLNIYQWGSRVYGTSKDNSDYDYNIIVTDDYDLFVDEDRKYSFEVLNCHLSMFHQTKWEKMMKENQIECLESIFSPQEFHIKETIPYFITIDIVELRKSISKVVSNAWDKCRKKLEIEKDFSPYIAKKSLWHSIRILMFGIQCVEYGKIVNFSEANGYYNNIVNNTKNDWLYYKDKWHGFQKEQLHKFKMLTNKEWEEYKSQ